MPYLNNQHQIEVLVKSIEHIYLNTDFLALKENCAATFLKLYLNN